MGEEENGFVAMIDDVSGEAGLVGGDHLDVIGAGNVGGGDDNKLAPVDAGAKLNLTNSAARNGAAHSCAVPHASALQIVDIFRAPQDLIHPLLADLRSADNPCFRNMRGVGGHRAAKSSSD
jgi:hypothetical protein